MHEAIAKANVVKTSPRLRSVINIRDKHLAHSLAQTASERNGAVDPMRYGDGPCLLKETIKIVDGLHIGINGEGFQWEDAREMARRDAEALWKSCTFAVAD